MLGCNIAYELHNQYEISGVDLIEVNMPKVKSFVFDILDFDKLEQCINKIKPDVIIHTAAAVNVDQCEKEPSYAEKLNVVLTKKICEITNQINAKIIYISTDAVFDGEYDELYDENYLVNPINVYGDTKLKGEEFTKKCDNFLILRTNIYGFNIQKKNSFGEWIYNSLHQGKTLNMFDDIDFSPILVNELVQLIDLSIEKNLKGIFHACGTGSITKYNFGCLLKQMAGIESGKIEKGKSEFHDFVAKRAKHMGMNNCKIKMELNCKIRTPKESIEEFCRLIGLDYKNKLIDFGGINYGGKNE